MKIIIGHRVPSPTSYYLYYYYYYYYYYYNHNYIKILESDWSSAGLISAVIVQFILTVMRL